MSAAEPTAGAPTAPQPTLEQGELEILGRMPWSSNATFLVEAKLHDDVTRAIYKPRKGERPLWDFPLGLYQREVAAYRLSAWLEWDVVPFTVVRDGPLGIGSVQQFIDAEFEEHYFTLLPRERYRTDLERICVLDLLANNTDRKSGHCLLGRDQRVYAIDNGLAFHHEPKLRTVIWDFADEPVPPALLADVQRLVDHGVPPGMTDLLDPTECDAIVARSQAVLRSGVFPRDDSGRRYPWPLV